MSGWKNGGLMNKKHFYETSILWTGNKGTGTSGYNGYDRSYDVKSTDKVALQCSADPVYLGDPQKYNPEELLVASVASCHMLWYLHLCAENEITVISYRDNAQGLMIGKSDGSGFFDHIQLNPKILVEKETMIRKALELHRMANEQCFIANSLNFPVYHEAELSWNN